MTNTARQEWLERRRAGIGASDIVAAVHKVYGGRYAVVADKLGHDTDLGDNQAEKARGHAWEQRIADAVQALTGMWVVGEQMEVAADGAPHHKATLDGLLATAPEATMADVVAPLEVKTAGKFVDAPWARWITQTRWQMRCCDLDRALIAFVRLDDDTNEVVNISFRWVERDLALEADLIELADELWGYVERGELPAPDCGSADDYAKHLTARSDPDAEVVDLTDLGDLIERRGDIKAALDSVDAEYKTINANIRAAMGEATKGVTASGWRISYSNPARVLDADGETAVLLAHPELAKTVLDRAAAKDALGKELDDFKAPIGHRTLRITPPKEQP